MALVIALGGVIYASKISYFKSFALLFALAASPVVISAKAYNININLSSLTLIVSLVALCIFFVALLRGALKTIFSILVFVTFMIPTLVFGAYYSYSGEVLSVEAITAALESNPAEAFEYLESQNSFWQYVIFAALLVLGAFWVKICGVLSIKKTRSNAYLAALFVILAASPLYTNIFKNRGMDLYSTLYNNAITHFGIYSEFVAGSPLRRQNTQILQDGEAGVYVLVIGESQDRTRMGVYGYERDTTPFLSSNLNNPNFIFFGHAFSNHSQTTQVLSLALTAKNQYNDASFKTSPSIMEIATWAGYDVHWISNQVKFSNGAPITQMTFPCKTRFFTQIEEHEEPYDEVLLDKIPTQGLGNKTLVVIHLFGSHFKYDKRYPSDFAKFGEGWMNEYDNSTLYNDFIMREIISRASKIPNFKALVYFSDHGESKDTYPSGGLIGHDAGSFNLSMTRIPLYMYFSDDYIAANPSLISNLKAHKDARFTNDLIFNLVSSIMGIHTSFDEPQNDISSELYDASADRFKTLHGKRFIGKDSETN